MRVVTNLSYSYCNLYNLSSFFVEALVTLEEAVGKLVSLILGPFGIVLFPQLWNAEDHSPDNVSQE